MRRPPGSIGAASAVAYTTATTASARGSTRPSGGLRTDSSHPGYEHVFIDPQIPEGVEWCRIGKETPYGRIDLGWEIADGELRIDVTLPPGVTATAITPAGACRGRLDGRRLAPQSPGTKIASGRHRLVFGLAPQNERQ